MLVPEYLHWHCCCYTLCYFVGTCAQHLLINYCVHELHDCAYQFALCVVHLLYLGIARFVLNHGRPHVPGGASKLPGPELQRGVSRQLIQRRPRWLRSVPHPGASTHPILQPHHTLPLLV